MRRFCYLMLMAFVLCPLISHGADEARGIDSLTALCFVGEYDAVFQYVGADKDINVTDSMGQTPLMAAVIGGENSDLTSMLIINHADMEARVDVQKWEKLEAAVLEGNDPYAEGVYELGKASGRLGLAVDDYTALQLAAIHNNFEGVRTLIIYGADVNAATATGKTTLMFAATEGNLDVLKLLIENKADATAEDTAGRTALNYIHDEAENKEAIVELLTHAAGPLHQNRKLLNAAETGSLEDAEAALAAGADINTTNQFGDTPLYLAVDAKQREMVAFLLEKGPKLDTYNTYGRSPLQLAAMRGSYRIIAMLLKAAADVNEGLIRSSEGGGIHTGQSPLAAAAEAGDARAVKQLLHAGAVVEVDDAYRANIESSGKTLRNGAITPLMHACAEGHVEVIEVLLENGADVNYELDHGTTAAHWTAMFSDNPDVVTVLNEAGANLDAKISEGDYEGMTPLLIAISRRNPILAEALINAGAGINQTNGDGLSALNLALLRKNTGLAKQLVETGANAKLPAVETLGFITKNVFLELMANQYKVVLEWGTPDQLDQLLGDDASDQVKLTALRYVVQKGNMIMIKHLLMLGADPMDAGDPTLLIEAADAGHVEVVALLLKTGADPEATYRGMTAIYLAAHNGHLAVIKELLLEGVAVNAADEKGHTPLMAACASGNVESVRMLLKAGADPSKRNADGKTAFSLAKTPEVRALLLE